MKGNQPVQTRKQKRLEKEKEIAIEQAMKSMERENRRLKINRMCAEIQRNLMAKELGQEIRVISVENFSDWIEKLREECGDGKN